jgi:serine/threonine-protein kinase
MASVYEAKHRNGSRAALKILHPHVLSNPTARQRFLSEGYAANKVEHPDVVLVLDDGEDGDLLFLVMELLSGRSLAERLTAEGPLPIKDVVVAGAAVLDVLAMAHDRHVVHRDIKPSNIFELLSGGIKVLDFGVARVRDLTSATLTESGVTLGTPAFMAPEQAAGRFDQVDALTDIWAVGATMFQLLTGRLVHEASTPNAAIVAAATRRVAPVRSVRPDVPAAVGQVVDRALAFMRNERWADARIMRRALLLAMPEVGPPSEIRDLATVPDTALSRRGGRPRRGRALLWVGVLSTLAGIALVLAFEMRNRTNEAEVRNADDAAKTPAEAVEAPSTPSVAPLASAAPTAAPTATTALTATATTSAPPIVAQSPVTPARRAARTAPKPSASIVASAASPPKPPAPPPAPAKPTPASDDSLIDVRQ